MSVVNNRLDGEERGSVAVDCLYSKRYRYLISSRLVQSLNLLKLHVSVVLNLSCTVNPLIFLVLKMFGIQTSLNFSASASTKSFFIVYLPVISRECVLTAAHQVISNSLFVVVNH